MKATHADTDDNCYESLSGHACITTVVTQPGWQQGCSRGRTCCLALRATKRLVDHDARVGQRVALALLATKGYYRFRVMMRELASE